MRNALALAISTLALGACAERTPLEPMAGRSLPPAGYGAKTTPDADALLVPPPQAVPVRNVELRDRSEERADDPYDLPPE